MSQWDLALRDARIATMRSADDAYGIIDDGVIGIAGGAVAWVGPASGVPDIEVVESRSLQGRWVTPALIDCHTHLIFGGDRAAEFERRLQGASYEDIARAGGGILSTVTATRAAEPQELFDSALARLDAIIASGAATVEIKSGYGLDVASELKMLEVARKLDAASDASISATLLAAHAIPPEYRDNPDEYIDVVCNELIPAAAERGSPMPSMRIVNR